MSDVVRQCFENNYLGNSCVELREINGELHLQLADDPVKKQEETLIEMATTAKKVAPHRRK